MKQLPKIDSHFHFFDYSLHDSSVAEGGKAESGLLGDFSPLLVDYVVDDYLADLTGHNVVKMVHEEADWDPDDPIGETRWLQGIADVHGFPHGIVGKADLASPELESVLERQCEFANFRGIRQCANWDDDPGYRLTARPHLMGEAAWRRGYPLLAKYGLTFDHNVNYHQLSEVAALMREVPDVRSVICHLGFPIRRTPEALEVWRRGIAEAAACPNALMKLSGITMTDHDWTTASIRPFFLEAIEAFSPARCMFGSNFPVDKLYGSFDRLFGAYYEIVAEFSDDEKRAMFHDTAATVYRL
jgi:predicted TIM-barrel fold metal-dependent hydrolase